MKRTAVYYGLCAAEGKVNGWYLVCTNEQFGTWGTQRGTQTFHAEGKGETVMLEGVEKGM